MLVLVSWNDSRADAGGNDAGADVEGLMTPDVAVPIAIVGEAGPAGSEAASADDSAGEAKPFL